MPTILMPQRLRRDGHSTMMASLRYQASQGDPASKKEKGRKSEQARREREEKEEDREGGKVDVTVGPEVQWQGLGFSPQYKKNNRRRKRE